MTCCLTPRTGDADLISWLSESLRGSQLVRGDAPLHAGAETQAVYVQAVGKKLLAALKEPELLAPFAAARDGEDLGRLRPALPPPRQRPC
ncbi:hypothetical protein [Streptomyces sioyaensis]|uniref:hypothetical protein n=1 Tax=Streptomyces sioyaensis TaxID=67364 RepID=UPI00379D4D72